MNIDRRDIAPLALQWFPTLTDASSDDWHFFLDKVTGLDTPLDMPNPQAFDRWRQALSALGYEGAFPYSESQIAAGKAKAAVMLEAEQKRVAALKAAPNQTAAGSVSGSKG